MKKLVDIINSIHRSMLWIVVVLILIMSLFIFYSVVMRYFFHKPVIWVFDLTSLFTGLSVFLAGGYALLMREHVRVDVFYQGFSKRTKSYIDALTSIFLFLMVIVFVWKGMEQVIHYYTEKSISTTGLNIYIWIKWIMMPIGGFLLGLQGIVNLINDIYIIMTGKGIIKEEGDLV